VWASRALPLLPSPTQEQQAQHFVQAIQDLYKYLVVGRQPELAGYARTLAEMTTSKWAHKEVNEAQVHAAATALLVFAEESDMDFTDLEDFLDIAADYLDSHLYNQAMNGAF
jgi:hypothetical protein